MKFFLLITYLFITPFLYAQGVETQKSNITTDAISIYDFKSLAPLLYTESNKVYIVNFWAMWCAPCVKELPIIEEYKKNNPNVEVLLVSLDFPENIKKSLLPFLKKKSITAKVVLLDDPDSNTWIDKIDPNWSGSLPFTILFNSKNRSFHERAFEDIQDLENEINKIINLRFN